MSEDRLQRIEAVLGALADNVGSLTSEMKTLRGEMTSLHADMATLRGEMATKQDLSAAMASLHAEMKTLRGEMATKQDLAACAKNVDVTLLGRQMLELLAMKDDVTVLTAIAQRLDHTMTRQMNDVLTEVRAEHSRMDRLLNRVRTLETAQPPDGIR